MLHPRIRSVLVPTDFSDASLVAFSHALRIALAFHAELDVFHVEPKNDTSDWHWAPGVLETLIRWGDLPEGSTAADLERLGVRARRSMVSGLTPDEAIFREITESHADLVVMSTHGRSGLARWLQPSVAMPVAVKGAIPVLLIPPDSQGFVRTNTGIGGIGRVMIAIDHRPHPAPAFDAAKLLLNVLPNPDIEIANLHVGEVLPETDLLNVPADWKVHLWLDQGSVPDRIAARAAEWKADLIVAVTEGRRNWIDNLRGSTVERLIEKVHNPLLIVPSEWTGEV